jgi:hypothetical protein
MIRPTVEYIIVSLAFATSSGLPLEVINLKPAIAIIKTAIAPIIENAILRIRAKVSLLASGVGNEQILILLVPVVGVHVAANAKFSTIGWLNTKKLSIITNIIESFFIILSQPES